MNGWEEPESVALDTYVRIQLARAADAYALHVDTESRLKAVLEAGREDKRDGATAAGN